MTKTVNIADLKDNLSSYVDAVQNGDDILICKRNLPVAKMISAPLRKNRTKLGFDLSVKILGDITGPIIPEEDWNMFAEGPETK